MGAGDYAVRRGDSFAFYGILRNTDLDRIGVSQDCQFMGEMYAVGKDSFPAVIRPTGCESVVTGTLWTPSERVSRELLEKIVECLDAIESFRPEELRHSMYIRTQVPVQVLETGRTVSAWLYVWNHGVRDLLRVYHGDWSRISGNRRMSLFGIEEGPK